MALEHSRAADGSLALLKCVLDPGVGTNVQLLTV